MAKQLSDEAFEAKVKGMAIEEAQVRVFKRVWIPVRQQIPSLLLSARQPCYLAGVDGTMGSVRGSMIATVLHTDLA